MRTKGVSLGVEELGARVVPATFTWNSAGAANWTTAAAWLEGGNPTSNVPGAGDRAEFPAGKGVCTVPANATVSVDALAVEADTDQQINVDGSLTVNVADAVNSGKFVTGAGGALAFRTGVFYSSDGHETYFDFSQGAGSFGGAAGAVYFMESAGAFEFKGRMTFAGGDVYWTYATLAGQGAADEIVFESDTTPVIATAVGEVSVNGLDKALKVLGDANSQFWIDTGGVLNVNGSGVYVGEGNAFVCNTDSELNVNGLCEGTSNSVMVVGKNGTDGSDFNLGDGSAVTTNGFFEARSTGTAGDSGLLVKGDATLDSSGNYFYDDTKVEFQGASKWTLTVFGGLNIQGDFGVNFRAAYGGTADKIVADEVAVTGSNNTVTTYFTGTPQAQGFLLIDTPNSYSGNFNTAQTDGAPPHPSQVAQGQLCTEYGGANGDLTIGTYIKP